MATGFEKQQQLGNLTAQKEQEIAQATQQKRVEMGGPVPGVEIDFPVGSPEYQRGEEAIRLANQPDASVINNFTIPTTQPSTPEMRANQAAIDATKPFYRRMIAPQVSPEFGGTGPFDPSHPNFEQRGQVATTSPAEQYQADLRDMPISALRAKYGNAAVADRMRLNLANANSQALEGQQVDLTDIANSAQIWAGNTARFGLGLLNLATQNVQDTLAEAVGRPEEAGQPTLLDRTGFSDVLKGFVEEQRKDYSPGTQLEQSQIAASKERFAQGGEERIRKDIESGSNPYIAEAYEQGRQLINTAEQYGGANNALTALIAESAPDLLLGGIVGKVAARSAIKDLAERHGADFAAKLLRTEGGKRQLENATEKAFVGYVGFQEAGSNMQQTLDEIDQMTPEQLAAKSPMYKDLIAEGYEPSQAKSLVRTQAANITAGVAGTFGALTGLIAAPFESKILTPSLIKGRGLVDLSNRVSSNIARETIEEGIQGATGQFASNLGIKLSADEQQSLAEDIGSNIAESAIAGAGMGGVGTAISETPKAVTDTFGAGAGAVNQVRERRAATRAQEFRDTVAAANETVQPTTTSESTGQVEPESIRAQDAVTSPEAKAVFAPIPEEQISSPDSIMRIARAISNRQMDESTRRELATVGNNVISAYEDALPQIQAQMDAAPEADKAQYQTAIDNINAVLEHPDVQVVRTTAESFKMTPEEVNEVFSKLPSEITPETYQSPDVQSGVKNVLAQIDLNSQSISSEQADTLINSADTIGLTDNQVNQLRLISASGKATSDVSNDVRNGSDGFVGVNQYTQAIIRAMATGSTRRANAMLDMMNNFANHMDTKAAAFQNAAANFTGNQPVEVINPATGQSYMSLDGTPMTYHPVRSKNLINQIQNDANAVRTAANAAAQLIAGETVTVPETQAQPTATPATETTQEAAPVEETVEAPTTTSETTSAPEIQTPAQTEIEASTPISEPVQGELFDKPEAVQSDIQLTEEPTEQVETDLMDKNQMELGLDKGVNHDILAGLQATTKQSTAASLSEADKQYQSTNQVKKWFKPTGKRSAFLRTSNFSGRLTEIFNNGQNPVTQLQNLFKGFVKPEAVTPKEAQVMRQYAALVPAIEQALIESWGKLTPEGQRIFWETYPVEYFNEVRNINDENVYFLPQPVIEAMTAGMMQWFVRNASETTFNDDRKIMDILGLDNKTRPTVEQANLLRNVGTDRQNVIDYLSREIFGVLGINADPNAPISVRDAVSKAMASEVLNVMINANLVQESVVKNSELAAVGSPKVIFSNKKNSRVFIRMNEKSEAATRLVELMQDSNDLLGQLTNPQRERAGAYFGTPPKGQSTKVKNGSGQDIPEKMLAARNKGSKQPHFINMGLHDLMLNKLGTEWIGIMLGIQSEENANGAHLKSIQSSNRTIERDINNLINGLTRMVEAGLPLATTPIYFAYNVISNYRMMLNSGDLNPQAAKLHRELVTVAPSTIELNNPLHGAFLDYAIAQGLGIAIDKVSSNTARERLNKVIDTGLFRDAINILKAAENQDFISDADAEILLEAVNEGKEKTKTLHALYAQAQYELAVEQGKTSFQTHIMLELDGVTNGPFNSIVQLGLKDVNQDLLNKLEKGGFFYGQPDRLYNDAAEEPGFLDLYKTAAAGSQQYINKMMDSVRNIPNRIAAMKNKPRQFQQKEMRDIERLKNQMRVTLAASKLIGDVDIVEGENVEHPIKIGRGLLKNPVTVTVYSGGANAINRKIAMGIVTGYYEAITEAVRAVDAATSEDERQAAIAHITDLTNTTNELTTAQVYRNGAWQQIGSPIDLGSDVTKFEFTSAQIEAITQNIKIGIGAAVNESIANEFGTVINRGKMMVYAAAVMHEVFMSRWNKEVERLETELRKEGKLSKYESLSQQQYNDIKNYLIGSMPIFNSWFTANNLDVEKLNEGILLSEEGRIPSDVYRMESRGRRELNGKMSRSTFGVDMPTYTEPGTRVMPLLVQSVEAAMQAIARDINPNNALNVFDGYINAVQHLESGSQAINQGVLQSWNEFDLLQDFTNRFEQAMDGVNLAEELGPGANTRLGQSFYGIMEMIGADETDSPTSPEVMEAFTALLKREAATQTAIKQGLLGGQAVTSINQMTGANIPFNIQNGKQVTEQTDELTDTRTPLEQLVANTELPTVESVSLPKGIVSIPPTRQMTEALDKNGRTVKGHDGVKVLSKDDVIAAVREAAKSLPSRQNRITGFILDKIINSIPNDINVYVGSPEALSGVQQKMNPDSKMQFTNQFLGLWEGQNIYIGSASIETVLHELIHAATAEFVHKFYTNPTSLSPSQRLEIESIENLMIKFINETSFSKNEEVSFVLNLIKQYMDAGDMEGATSEFIAWGLSNPRMIDALTTKGIKGAITNVLKSLADSIKKMFAIGSNPEIDSYWTRLLGHTVALVDSTTGTKTTTEQGLAQQNMNNVNNLDAETLFNKLDGGKASAEHINHLTDTLDYLQSNIVRLIKQTGENISGLSNFQDKLMLDSIDPEIDKSPDALIANGFNMTEKEALVFKLLQVSLKYGLDNFTPSVLTARSLYAQAKRELTVQDFLTDPNNQSQFEMDLARQRYDAVFGNSAVVADATGRSNRLANFIALVETNESLRNKLGQIPVRATRETPATNFVDRVGQLVNRILVWLSGLATRSLTSRDIASRLSVLAKNISHVDSTSRDTLFGRIWRGSENIVESTQDKLKASGNKLRKQLQRVEAKVPGSVAFGIKAGSAVFNDQDAEDVRTAITNIVMTMNQKDKLNAISELVFEFVGTNETNQTIHTLLTQKNMAADRARQIIREMVPGMIEKSFVSLNQTEKEAIQKVVANTDMAYLFANNYSLSRLNELLTNPAELNKEIQSMESQLNSSGGVNSAFYIKSAHGLAQQMVYGVSPLAYQLSNAGAIARLIGTGRTRPNDTAVETATQLIDTLASLSALRELSDADKAIVSNVMKREMTKGEPNNNGMTFTLKYYRSLQQAELAKAGGDATMSAVKGFTPTLADPNKKVVIASVKDEAMLSRKGYVRGARVPRDSMDFRQESMYYYHSNNGGEPRWIAGVMSTLQTTVGGVNPLTGRSVNGYMTPGAWTAKERLAMNSMKRGEIDKLFDPANPMPKTGASYMQPVLNQAGTIMGYSYQMPRANKEAHLDIDNDFTKVMAAWEGRIAEEIQAARYNNMLMQRLHEMYKKDARMGNAYQYLTINKNSTDPQLKEIYELMPIEMKEMAKEIWPNGDIKVRKDLLNNAFGYREPSVLNMWTGNSGYSKEFEQAFVSIAETFLGKNAARYLRLGERGIMEFVKEMKDWIVVRSVVVSAANLVSNMVHLATIGISPITMAKDMSTAVLAAEEYRRNEKIINEYSHYLAVGHNPQKAGEYQRRISELKDFQARNPVAELIQAGLLPTIAEDLGQQDDYSLKDKMVSKLSQYTDGVPEGVKRAAKEIALSRDSHVYFFLNRSIQYGDFVAKYSMYKQLTTRKNNPLDKESALAQVMSEFINYDVLPSRTRAYLDAMGLTWFLNYKIRIQKIILKTIRENPIRALFLMSHLSSESALPNITDANLITGSMDYNIGMGTAANGLTIHPLVALF
ncbi:hypothetical protein DNY80_23120 [Salmonella enterica subsp. enterica serovar Kentucky]|nr:hypothetical protein [Salmonella enterica subsp. enterica serovar Kentucky]